MMAEKPTSIPPLPPPPPPKSGKLLRRSNSDRLRMHAPSSIKIAAPTATRVSEWKIAIPLLSPLDPAMEIGARESDETVEPDAVVVVAAETRWSGWQHPAAPFYYEPLPSGAASFLLPHCA